MADRAPIVGLIGYAGAGKDTLAKQLVDRYGWARLAFADPLRQALLTLDPSVRLDNGTYTQLTQFVAAFGWDHAKQHKEVRRLLQVMGTEVVRNLLGEHTWTQLMAERIDRTPRSVPIVVTDVRFANEISMLAVPYQAQFVRIDRPGLTPVNDHVSESLVANFQGPALRNDCRPEELCDRLLSLLEISY